MEEKRSESKSKLNESTLPLLDDSEHIEPKEKSEIEMKFVEKEDAQEKEKESELGQADGKDGEKEDAKPKKKEKSHRRTVSCAETMTAGLNLLDRDEKRVNDHVNLVFEDILAESDATHSFDGSWKASYIVFSGTKLWIYRLLMALISIPFALIWGLVFSVLILLNVWVVTPFLQVFYVLLFPFRKVLSGAIHAVLDPIFQSVGLMFSAFHRRQQVEP